MRELFHQVLVEICLLQLRRIDVLYQLRWPGRLRQMWKKKRSLSPIALASTLMFAVLQTSYATNYYVDADGGDDANPGTLALPWKTIHKVMVSAGSYDSVYFQRGDTWKDELDVPASNMIFDAYGEGAKPTIDGDNTALHAFYIAGHHDIVIRNFNIINVRLCGIQFSTFDENITYNLTVANNDFTNMGSNGVRTFIPHDVQLSGLRPYGVSIKGNTFTDLGNFAIGLNVTDTAPNIISGNIITRAGNGKNQTNAIQLSAKGVIVEKNIIMDTKGGPYGDGHAIIVDWGVPEHLETASEDVTVRYNFVSGSNTSSQQAGIHIYYGKNSSVYGNISVNNSIGYKLSNAASTGNAFYNNVAYSNTVSAARISSTAPISTWQNNIFYGVNDNDVGMSIYGKAPVESNNIFYNFATTFRVLDSYAATMHPSDIISDPLFQNPLSYDFSLQSSSPAINMGADLTNTVSGLIMPGSISPDNIALVDQSSNSTWEIGAYAYSDTNFGNNAPSLPILVSPANNESIQGSTAEFIWQKSTDPDMDTVTYRLTLCTDESMTSCFPVDVAMNHTGIFNSGSTGMLIIGMTFITGLNRRRRNIPVFVIIVLFGCMSLMSCEKINDLRGITGSASVSTAETKYTASDLTSGTTYYWKVVADDAQGGITESAVWNFSTQ